MPTREVYIKREVKIKKLRKCGLSACSGKVPGHSLGQATGVQRYGTPVPKRQSDLC